MRFLLDTHIWLWSLLEPAKVPQNIRDVLEFQKPCGIGENGQI